MWPLLHINLPEVQWGDAQAEIAFQQALDKYDFGFITVIPLTHSLCFIYPAISKRIRQAGSPVDVVSAGGVQGFSHEPFRASEIEFDFLDQASRNVLL